MVAESAQSIPPVPVDTATTAETESPRRILPLIILAILLLCAIAGAVYYYTVYRFFESTDNAYVKADVTWVIPRVSGEITSLLVKENQKVSIGQLLMTLDDRDTQAHYAQAAAMVGAKQAAIGVQQQNEIAARAAIQQAKASVAAANPEIVRLKKELDRYTALLKQGVTTRQRLESVQAQYAHALDLKVSAEAAVVTAQAQAESVHIGQQQLLADVKSSEANAAMIAVDTSSAKITAPVGGIVGNLAVRLGSRVNSQTRVLAIVPNNSAYIEANFKETQIGKMQVGQKVKLTFDAYADKTFHGHIDSFSPASGATFSLMPPDNATGNFNKVVQRIPVRIVVDDMTDATLLRPGLSVTAVVDLRK